MNLLEGNPFPLGFVIAVTAVVVLEGLFALMGGREQPPTDSAPDGTVPREGPRPSWSLGVVLACATFPFVAGGGNWTVLPAPGEALLPMEAGPALWLIALCALPLMAAGWQSDRTAPRSERHLLALLVSALATVIAGVTVGQFSMFGMGAGVELGWLLGSLIAAFWIFLVVSVVELASLLPLASGLIILGLGLASWSGGGTLQTVASNALAGMVVGALVGRVAGSLLFSGGRALQKSEILPMGYFAAVLTMLSLLKSATLAGIVLPLGVLSVGGTVLALRAFERSLLLRKSPRG